ncbi:MAG: type II toxin-antitoxin system HicA family toxin [Clostridia bacterium]|nr:type II toxin-antitoxin system HicA family toxin [Clostridia bacterium]
MKGDYIVSTKDFVNLISNSGFTPQRQRGSHQTFVHEVLNATIQIVKNKPTIGTGVLKDQLSILVFSQLVSNNNPKDVGKWVETIKNNKIQNLIKNTIKEYAEQPFEALPPTQKKLCATKTDNGAKEFIEREREKHIGAKIKEQKSKTTEVSMFV